MSDLLRHSRAELLKVTTGRAAVGSLLGGALWAALTGYGYYAQGKADVAKLYDKGPEKVAELASAALTGDVLRGWMMMLLFSAIVGAMIVTREVSGQTLSRSVLSYGGRDQVFLSKLLAGLCVSTVFAVVAMAGAVINYLLVARAFAHDLVWNGEATKTLLGVGASVLIAGVFGLMLGWLVRNQTLSVIAVLVLFIGIEPAVQRFAPEVAQFLFTIALSAIYQDPKPDLLPVWGASVAALVWVAGLGFAAHTFLRRRDVG